MIHFVVTETLLIPDGRAILRLQSEHNGEYIVRIPPIEYRPKFGDPCKLDSLRCFFGIKESPPINIGHDWWACSGTAVGAPLDRFIDDYRSRPEDVEA